MTTYDERAQVHADLTAVFDAITNTDLEPLIGPQVVAALQALSPLLVDPMDEDACFASHVWQHGYCLNCRCHRSTSPAWFPCGTDRVEAEEIDARRYANAYRKTLLANQKAVTP